MREEYDVVYALDELNLRAAEGWFFTAFLGRDTDDDVIFLIERVRIE